MAELIVTTSWDDGSESDLALSDLLVKHGIRGTFYISKNYLDTPLKADDLKTLSKHHEIGAHTLNHTTLTEVSHSKAKEEIEGSKAYLENLLEQQIYMFCYPYGKYNKTIEAIVRAAGFKAARTCEHARSDRVADPFEWNISLHASNGSPLMSLKICLKSGISVRSLLDWEIRAKLLFNAALRRGGIYHIWGHSQEISKKDEWDKLDRVLDFISNREGVKYLTNGEIFNS